MKFAIFFSYVGGGDILKSGKQPLQEEVVLLKAAQKGDIKAFEKLVHLYQDRVIATAYLLVNNTEDARDIAQEVFVRVYRSLSKFHTERKFFTWLHRITVNVCWDFLHKRNRFQTISIEKVSEQNPGLMQMPEQEEIAAKIIELVNLLSTPRKTAFLLREVEGFSCKEIAQILDLPQGTVRSHLFHARRILRDLLQKHYPEFLEGLPDEKMQG